MKDIVCPICGKNGIPDYHSQDVVCPCCESDLTIYRLVERIETESKSQVTVEEKPRKTGFYIMSALAAVFLCIAVFCFVCSLNYNSALKTEQQANTVLLQTNKDLEKALAETQTTVKDNVTKPSFHYVVREGDSFWTISRKLYGTGSRYKEIAEANNLDVNSVLNVGDELIIQ